MDEHNDIMELLDDEYVETIQMIRLSRVGTEEAEWRLKKAEMLHKHRMDELEIHQKMKDGRKDRIIKLVCDGAAIIIPVMASSYWMAKGLIFEKEGTFTSRTSQWISSFKLFKK